MPRKTPVTVSQAIEKLLAERQANLDAVAAIESTLDRVSVVLGQGGPSKKSSASQSGASDGHSKRRRRRRFAMTGDESILAFIKQQKNPTSQEIERHWKSEGRGGAAANLLTKLFQQKQLTRERLKEGRGSRYSLA